MTSSKTKEITVTVTYKTYDGLLAGSETLGISIGEVIDRLVCDIKVNHPEIAAMFLVEQFTIATLDMNEDDLKETLYQVAGMLLLPLVQSGFSMSEVFAAQALHAVDAAGRAAGVQQQTIHSGTSFPGIKSIYPRGNFADKEVFLAFLSIMC